MARTRAFAPDEALEKAMQVFWAKGYGETSIDDLVEATGVSRYGLYSIWRDKRGLFLAVLDRYRDCQVGMMLAQLEMPTAARAEVEDLFNTFARGARSEGAWKGCLFANTAAEFGTDDKDVAARVTKHYRRLERNFKKALERAKRLGEVRDDFDADAAAIMLAGLTQGLMLMLRAGEPAKKIETFAKGALAILR